MEFAIEDDDVAENFVKKLAWKSQDEVRSGSIRRSKYLVSFPVISQGLGDTDGLLGM